jgi:hypothetical protein
MDNWLSKLWRSPEVREKLTFTLFILLVYRIGAHITVPGLDVGVLREQFGQLQGTLFGVYDMFVGGGLSRATIFALGIMPYISASIMFQLLAAVFPTVEKLQKEGAHPVDALHHRGPLGRAGIRLRRVPAELPGCRALARLRLHLHHRDRADGGRGLRDVAR